MQKEGKESLVWISLSCRRQQRPISEDFSWLLPAESVGLPSVEFVPRIQNFVFDTTSTLWSSLPTLAVEKEDYTFELFNNFYEKQVIFTMATGINAKECLSHVSLFYVWLREYWTCWMASITLIKRHSKNVLESLINYLKWFTFIIRGIYFIQLFFNFKKNSNWHFGIQWAPIRIA